MMIVDCVLLSAAESLELDLRRTDSLSGERDIGDMTIEDFGVNAHFRWQLAHIEAECPDSRHHQALVTCLA